MKPEQETDIRTSADRVLQFRKTLLTLYTEDEDPFERLVARPQPSFVPEPLEGEEREADEYDQETLQEFRRAKPAPILRLESCHNGEQQAYAKELASRWETHANANALLGAAQFHVDVVDKIASEDKKVSEMISIVVECHHYDSIDPFSKPIVFTREELETTLYNRYVKTFAKAKRSIFENLPALKGFFDENKSLDAIKLAVPRYEALSAMVMALTYSTNTKNELSIEGENVFEVYAIASILGIDGLQELCRQRIQTVLTQGAAVLAGDLATRYGDIKLLEIVHSWIQVNILEPGKLTTIESDGLLTLDKQTLVFRRFRLHSSVFRDVIKTKLERSKPYLTPQGNREALRLVRERPADGSEAFYYLLKPDTGALRLAARYDPVRGEYIISRSKNIVLHNEDYVGGVTFNIAGTVFTAFDAASRCTVYSGGLLKGFDEPRTELGAVVYVRNFFGWEPREFTIVVPRELKNIPARQGLFGDYYSYEPKDFVHIRNRPPKWNEERATYTLDFRNHVKKASKKNFILEVSDSEAKEVMMMGKLERDNFYVHFNEPLSLLMTFGVCLSSFHKKRLVK